MTRKKAFFPIWSVIMLTVLAVAFFIRHCVFTPYEVYGRSMNPTLQGGELLLVNKWIYKLSNPEFGDIIVFHTREGENHQPKDFIKRVIGLPGDHIVIEHGHVFRNGQRLIEPYIQEPMEEEKETSLVVPNGKLFVLGDNRNDSKDSREIGPIELKEVVGRAEWIIYPMERMKWLVH
ncbi:signal peptidase I [Thermoflavimicrobium dichotomicum]|uniref:Signal peptidase I n=1 Tax=Thermoflavimicrobium dichotomicum TaxID=46223 RepID=A0A1I3QMV4_9BACL|nr:signal peptidase I [Thermoflavimicrobium dichotomicum]SFJ35150.1 signal peptidase I [Thermoflavimicrobium dichotomicum]